MSCSALGQIPARFVAQFVAVILAAAILVTSHGNAAQGDTTAVAKTASATDKATPGVGIGKATPDFQLQDQSGKQIQLKELLKAGPVAIVFHRSAKW